MGCNRTEMTRIKLYFRNRTFYVWLIIAMFFLRDIGTVTINVPMSSGYTYVPLESVFSVGLLLCIFPKMWHMSIIEIIMAIILRVSIWCIYIHYWGLMIHRVQTSYNIMFRHQFNYSYIALQISFDVVFFLSVIMFYIMGCRCKKSSNDIFNRNESQLA